jgi:putative Mn2+ efflux pump MntP
LDIISLLFVAVGLAMDAFSVAITDGIVLKNRLRMRNALKIGLFFGFFQAVMPMIGWFLGINFRKYIEACDHWIAFILLAVIGGKMIFDAIQEKKETECELQDPLNNKVLFMLAIATSIDALAVGITLATVNANILLSAAVIGIVAFVFSVAGVYIGKKSGDLFGNKAEIIGGVVLIGIGLKILIEHVLL